MGEEYVILTTVRDQWVARHPEGGTFNYESTVVTGTMYSITGYLRRRFLTLTEIRQSDEWKTG